MADKIPSSEITPREVYFNRRAIMRGGVVAASAVATGFAYRKINGVEIVETETKQLPGLVKNPTFDTTEELTPKTSITNYNNFYEFTTNKDGVAKAAAGFSTAGWKLEVGGLCHKPKTFGMEDLM